jgi:UDP-N-acetylglucosamine--N-acetylmuramyl-(pentapeptide) pyrophosphoryl-undecaprenol N-acetylglucosamine transferase
MKPLRIIFAGGGTGGHLFPALAIADKLKSLVVPQYKPEFLFVGTRRGIEYSMRDRLGYPLTLISVRGLSRSGIRGNLMFPLMLLCGTVKSMYLILRLQPALVVGTGGYVMGPVILAAVALNRRCVIQEQNSYPGLTTRRLASKVDKVFLGFGSAARYLGKNCISTETGNPVKETIGKPSQKEAREYFRLRPTDKTILILGGSQGAASLNANILGNLDTLPDNYQLIWQTGPSAYEQIRAAAGNRISNRALFPFTDRIELAYAAADMAIARAGALTLAELEAAGLPAILVPYPFAAGDHQTKNAEYFVEKAAARLIEDNQLPQISLLAEAVNLIESGQAERMAAAADALRRRRTKPSVDLIVDEILDLINVPRSDI